MFCGPKGIRTPDLLDANEARYQLRHRPVNDIYVITLAIPDMTKAPHLRVFKGSRGLRGGGDGGM